MPGSCHKIVKHYREGNSVDYYGSDRISLVIPPNLVMLV